jgi:hypothetical protein
MFSRKNQLVEFNKYSVTGTNSQSTDIFEPERFPSGQRGQTVNLLAMPSEVRILPSPPGLPADDLDNFSPVDDSSPVALNAMIRKMKNIKTEFLFPRSWTDTGASRNERAGVAQLVEHQPSKLRVAGSIPVSRSNFFARHPLVRDDHQYPASLSCL